MDKDLGCIKPGSWSNGFKPDVDAFEREFRQEIEQAKKQKDDLIVQASADGIITEEMSSLFRTISTVTSGNFEWGNLRKIQSALAFGSEVSKSEGRVAYVGAGTDWQFPVALGLTQIDMVDISYPQIVLRMLDSIRSFDSQLVVRQNGETVDAIEFNIDLGQGVKKVRLNIVPGGVEEYFPSVPLVGVIEALGPSKRNDGTSPVLPGIARALEQGAFILNLDFNQTRLREGSGLEDFGRDDVTFYRVLDQESLILTSIQASVKSSAPSLDAIRNAAERDGKRV